MNKDTNRKTKILTDEKRYFRMIIIGENDTYRRTSTRQKVHMQQCTASDGNVFLRG